MPKLTIEEGGRSTVYEILDDVILIGRREGVSVRLADEKASVEHCQIRMVPGVGFKLVDLESRNGTKVNGAYVNQRVLAEGDVIQIGDARLRISGLGAPVPAAAPATPPRPVVASPAARPEPYGPAAARPPSYEERERRPYRRRPTTDTPLVLAAAAAGVVVVLLLVVYLASAWFGTSKNEKVYQQMVSLMDQNRYQDALAKAQEADPDGDRAAWRKVQAEKAHIHERLKSGSPEYQRRMAQAEYLHIQGFIQAHPKDVAGAIQRWNAFAKKWRTAAPFWAGKASDEAEKLRHGGAAASRSPASSSSGPPSSSTGSRSSTNGALGTDWEKTRANVARFEGNDRFQAAIDALFKFWDDDQLETGSDYDQWKAKVDAAVKDVQDRAQKRWNELESQASRCVDDGVRDQAVKIMQGVVDNFGMEKYVALARQRIKQYRSDR